MLRQCAGGYPAARAIRPRPGGNPNRRVLVAAGNPRRDDEVVRWMRPRMKRSYASGLRYPGKDPAKEMQACANFRMAVGTLIQRLRLPRKVPDPRPKRDGNDHPAF